MTRRQLFALAAPAAFSGCSTGLARLDSDSVRRRTLERGVEFLRGCQSSDGAWRSSTYGLLSSGDSLTAFIAYALAEHDSSDPAIRSALDYLLGRISTDGGLGMVDRGLPDYPNYTTAFCLRVLLLVRPLGWRAAADRLIEHLLSRQFREADGWTFETPPHGAWGMGGAVRTPPEAGHVDLSMTRHVLEALAHAGLRSDDSPFRRARVYVDRCRNADGGFHFSTVVDEANKAGRRDRRWLSYGTATADGIRAARMLGLADASAVAWLRKHHQPNNVSGFDDHPDERWKDGLWFYYVASAAPFLSRDQQTMLAATLASRQLPDGSWRNPEPLVKEDDPLIATTLAVRALLAS